MINYMYYDKEEKKLPNIVYTNEYKLKDCVI
jgi:hypothetical protein